MGAVQPALTSASVLEVVAELVPGGRRRPHGGRRVSTKKRRGRGCRPRTSRKLERKNRYER
jgi:hypothetical protein